MTENKPGAADEAAETNAAEQDTETSQHPVDGDEAVVDEELQDLGAALSAAEQELLTHRDAMLRMQAEMDNLRKRLIRDLEKSRKFALEGVMKDLLGVRDSLERGLDMIDDSTTIETMKEGKELTLKMLNKVLSDHGLEVIDPRGEQFNPEFHEAVAMVPSAEHEENTVIDVLQKGFILHDRLIRPATVVVSSAA